MNQFKFEVMNDILEKMVKAFDMSIFTIIIYTLRDFALWGILIGICFLFYIVQLKDWSLLFAKGDVIHYVFYYIILMVIILK